MVPWRTLAPILLLALLLSTACSPAPPPLMRIGTNVWIGYEPLHLARALGYLDERSVRLVEYQSATDVLRAFRNRTIDLAALTLDEAMLLAQDTGDVRVVLVLDQSAGADAILARKGIGSMADVRGKRVGVEASAVGAYMLMRALQENGLSLADVQVVQLPEDRHEQAFLEGKVDVIVTFDPVRSRLLKSDARVLFDSRMIPGEIVDVLVARRDFADGNPGQVERLVSAWFRALGHLDAEPADALKRMAVREQLTPAELKTSLEGIRFPDRDENRALVTGRTPGLLATAERLKRTMIGNRILAGEIDARLLFVGAPAGAERR